MGLFDFLIGTKEEREEAERKRIESEALEKERLLNSDFAKFISGVYVDSFTEGNEHLVWMMTRSDVRYYKLEVFPDRVLIVSKEISRERLKATNTYDVEKEALTFARYGYEDLPRKYTYAFKKFLLDSISKNCPLVTVKDDIIELANNAKKSW